MSEPEAKRRILIVEDEFLVRLTLAEALADEGFDVLEAASGDEALAMLEAGAEIAVLLTDVQLPGKLNGLNLVRLARQARPELPAIYMSGRPDTMAGSLETQRDIFITKPYLPSEITAAIRRFTDGW